MKFFPSLGEIERAFDVVGTIRHRARKLHKAGSIAYRDLCDDGGEKIVADEYKALLLQLDYLETILTDWETIIRTLDGRGKNMVSLEGLEKYLKDALEVVQEKIASERTLTIE